MHSMNETVAIVSELGVQKVNKPMAAKWILGFIGGALVSLSYMAYIMITSMIPGGVGVIVGACVFPVGLLIILFAGGELITGNMTVVATSLFNKKVGLKALSHNWVVITLANYVGALFVSLVFAVLLGAMKPYQEHLVAIAQSKVHYDPLRLVISGLACNWFVGLGVWLSQSFKAPSAKIIGVWFPVMVFVILGFQHSVANMFLLSTGMAYGGISISQFVVNFIFSYLGNMIGGSIFVGLFYTIAAKHPKH